MRTSTTSVAPSLLLGETISIPSRMAGRSGCCVGGLQEMIAPSNVQFNKKKCLGGKKDLVHALLECQNIF